MKNDNRNQRFSESQRGHVNENRRQTRHNEDPYRGRHSYGQQSQGSRNEDAQHRQGTSHGNAGQQSYGPQGQQQYGQHQGGQNYGTSDYGSQDHLSDNYGSNYGRQDYGGSNFGSSYGQDYNQRTSYGSGQGDNYGRRDNDWSEKRNMSNQQSGTGMHDENRHSYRDEYGRYRANDQQVNREEPRNRYGGDTSNYGNANQGGFDRNWWDRAKDEVSSWFGDDDADRRRHGSSGPHKGKGPKGYKRSDERIREDVCDRLCDNPMIDASNIDIKVEGSEVILTGTVDSREDKRRAEDIAETISGVSNVQNQIRVSPRDNIGSGSRYDSHERNRE